jgi:hypothetical protein
MSLKMLKVRLHAPIYRLMVCTNPAIALRATKLSIAVQAQSFFNGPSYPLSLHLYFASGQLFGHAVNMRGETIGSN